MTASPPLIPISSCCDLPVQDVLRLVWVDIESYVIHFVSENLFAHVDVYAVKLAQRCERLSCVMHHVAGAKRIINGCKHPSTMLHSATRYGCPRIS